MTASDILQGEGEALNVDNRDYYQQLYWTMKHWWPAKLNENSASDEDGECELLSLPFLFLKKHLLKDSIARKSNG